MPTVAKREETVESGIAGADHLANKTVRLLSIKQNPPNFISNQLTRIGKVNTRQTKYLSKHYILFIFFITLPEVWSALGPV